MAAATTTVAAAIASQTGTSTQTATSTQAGSSTISSFSAAASCGSDSLTMMLNQQDRVWLNYPYPASNLTSSACYPPDILSSLATPFAQPATSVLLCPEWYTTNSQWTSGYAACCPNSYTLALVPTGAPASRPAYSATCYSNMLSATTVTAYDNVTITSTQAYNNPSAQAYAMVIDGFIVITGIEIGVASSTAIPVSSAAVSSAAVSSATSSTTDFQSKQVSISGGAIAGAAIAACFALFFVGIAAWFLGRRYRSRQAAEKMGEKMGMTELHGESAPMEMGGETVIHELGDGGGHWQNKIQKQMTQETFELSGDNRRSHG